MDKNWEKYTISTFEEKQLMVSKRNESFQQFRGFGSDSYLTLYPSMREKDKEQNTEKILMAVAGECMGVGSPVGVLGIPGDWKLFPECFSHVTKESILEITILVCPRCKEVDKKDRLVINPRASNLPQ